MVRWTTSRAFHVAVTLKSGIPKLEDGGKPTEFVEALILKLLGEDNFQSKVIIDWVHWTQWLPPPEGTKSHTCPLLPGEGAHPATPEGTRAGVQRQQGAYFPGLYTRCDAATTRIKWGAKVLRCMREMLRVTAAKWFGKMSAKDCYESKRRKGDSPEVQGSVYLAETPRRRNVWHK